VSGDLIFVLRTSVAKPANQKYSVSCNPLKRHKSREGNNWYQVVYCRVWENVTEFIRPIVHPAVHPSIHSFELSSKHLTWLVQFYYLLLISCIMIGYAFPISSLCLLLPSLNCLPQYFLSPSLSFPLHIPKARNAYISWHFVYHTTRILEYER